MLAKWEILKFENLMTAAKSTYQEHSHYAILNWYSQEYSQLKSYYSIVDRESQGIPTYCIVGLTLFTVSFSDQFASCQSVT